MFQNEDSKSVQFHTQLTLNYVSITVNIEKPLDYLISNVTNVLLNCCFNYNVLQSNVFTKH